MVIPDIIFSLAVALLISIIFARILTRKGPRKGFVWFFLAIFLAVLAVGLWAKPYGEPLTGSNWIPFLLAGILMALLLFFLAPKFPEIDRDAQLNRKKTLEMLDSIERNKKITVLTYISFNFLIWALLFLLIGLVITRIF